jgi:hypothetical protein
MAARVSLTVTEKKDTVLIAVADTGVGIPEKFHAQLFDKFNPARRPGLKGEPSVGLGMFIIKTIIEWHKGSLRFESGENKGACFFIEYPKPINPNTTNQPVSPRQAYCSEPVAGNRSSVNLESSSLSWPMCFSIARARSLLPMETAVSPSLPA